MADKKVTDADLMTGFNPAFGVSAEEIEARQADGDVESVTPEGAAADGGDATPGAPAEPEEVDVRLDGKVVKAPRDIADAFTREINRRDGTRGAELQQLRERLAHLEGAASATRAADAPAADPEPQVPNPELQIDDPAEYQRQLLAFVTHQQEKKTGALTQQYAEDQAAKEQEAARRAAWSGHVESFYSKPENAVLRENRDIVDLVLEQHRADLAPLDVESGFKELGRLTKERLAKMTGSAPEMRARTPRPANVEGSVSRAAAAQPSREEDGPRSLTQAMKERRQRAAVSFGKGGSGRPVALAR